MSDHMPGNPFIDRPANTGSGEISNAIEALAFEVRTANLQRQAAAVADPTDWTGTEQVDFEIWAGMQTEIARRLGVQ